MFQVFKDGVLAYLCPTEFPSYYENAFEACEVKGDLVYMAVPPKSNDFVDDQKVTLPEDICFVPNGTYRYSTKDRIMKTVRMISIAESKAK